MVRGVYVYREPPSNHSKPNPFLASAMASFETPTNNRRAPVAPVDLVPDSDSSAEKPPRTEASHLLGSVSFQERAELALHRLLYRDRSVPAPPRQQPTAQEAPSRSRRSAFYDPVRDTVLPPPESSSVAAEPVQDNTLSDDGNIEPAMGTEPSPTLSEPSFRNIAGNNTQFAVPNAHVEIDLTTALTIKLSDSRRPLASAFRRTSVTAVEPNQYQNHGQEEAPLPQTPPQPATQAPSPKAPRPSPIPQRVTRLQVPATYNDMISQETLLRQSNPELHEQVREAASYGFTTTLHPGKKRSSDAALSPPSEGQEEPPRKKLHNRGGARPGAGRPATKMLKQLASGTGSASKSTTFKAGSLWDKPTSAIGPSGNGPGYDASVAGAGALSGSYSAPFAFIPSADPHIQPSNSLSASAGPSDLQISGMSPNTGKKRKADGADVHSVDETSSVSASASFAVSVAVSVLEILEQEPMRSPRGLDIEKDGGDAEGEKREDTSSTDKKEVEPKNEVVEQKAAGEETNSCEQPEEESNVRGWHTESTSPKGKAEEASKAKASDCTTKAKEDKETQPVSKGTQKGNGKGKAKRKAEAITPVAEPAAEEPAKDEPPAKRLKTAAMSSPAVSQAPVRRSARPRKPTAKVRDNMLQ